MTPKSTFLYFDISIGLPSKILGRIPRNCPPRSGVCEMAVAQDCQNSQGLGPWLSPNHMTSQGSGPWLSPNHINLQGLGPPPRALGSAGEGLSSGWTESQPRRPSQGPLRGRIPQRRPGAKARHIRRKSLLQPGGMDFIKPRKDNRSRRTSGIT